MSIIISILVLLLFFIMMLLPSRKKIGLLFFSCLCLQAFSFSFVSFGSAPKMLCLSFFLSELPKAKIYFRYLRSSKVGRLVTITIIGVIVLEIYSKYAHNPLTAVGLVINDLIAKYFIILYVIVCFKSLRELKYLLRIAYWSSLIMTFFGLLNLVTGTSIITELAGGDGTEFSGMERVRIVGMFTYAFDYGFTCCILSIFAFYGYSTKQIAKSRFTVIMICSMIGIIICGCRTVIIVEAAVILVYIFFRFSIIKAVMLSLCGIGCVAGAYVAIPSVQNKVNMVLLAFDTESSGEDADGSSLMMRVLQYDTVLSYVRGNEILGRGYRYFIEGLGYNKNGNGFQDLEPDAQPLMGLEGVLMNLLLERGIVGVLIYFVFYIGIIAIAFKSRKTNPNEATAVIAMIIGFMLFGNITGELSEATITLLLSGVLLKVMYLKKRTTCRTKAESNILDGHVQYCIVLQA